MNVWQIPYTYLNLKPGQSLFIQQWGVETSGRSPLVSLRLRTSIKELLREIVDLTTLVETGQMKSRSLASIADELKYHLHANDLLRGSFPEDIALLNDIVRKNTDPNDIERWKTVRIVVSAFLKKLDAVDLPFLYHQRLKVLLESENTSYEKIRTGVRVLVSELVAKGYSLRHLHQWGHGVLVRDAEPDFMTRYDRIQSDLGNKDERPFDCVLKFRLPAAVDFSLAPFETTDASILDELREGDPKTAEACMEFFQAGVSYVRVNLHAMDRIAAAEKAHKMLTDQLALWRLIRPDYDPGIPHKVLVVEEDRSTARVIQQVNLSDSLRVGNLRMFMSQRHQSRTDARDSIARALHWVRLAAESPREVRFTTLWSALEALVAGRSRSHTIESIAEAVSAILGLDIMRRRLIYTLNGLEKRLRGQASPLEMQTVAAALSGLVTGPQSDRIALWTAAIENRDELVALHDPHDEWFKAEYAWLAAARDENQRSLYRFLDEFAKSVRMSLFRLYRLRNNLTHQAAVDPQGLDDATAVIGHYLNSILNAFIYTLDRNPALTMDELVRCYVWTYEELVKRLRNESLTTLDLREVVAPTLRLCQ